jgi:hypothetical protein
MAQRSATEANNVARPVQQSITERIIAPTQRISQVYALPFLFVMDTC